MRALLVFALVVFALVGAGCSAGRATKRDDVVSASGPAKKGLRTAGAACGSRPAQRP